MRGSSSVAVRAAVLAEPVWVEGAPALDLNSAVEVVVDDAGFDSLSYRRVVTNGFALVLIPAADATFKRSA